MLDAGQRIAVADIEEKAPLELDFPGVADAPLRLDEKRGRLIVHVGDSAHQSHGVLHVVEAKPHAGEDVVVEGRGRRIVLVAAVVEILRQEPEIGRTLEDLEKGVFQPADRGGKGVALALADDALELPEPGLAGVLDVEAALVDQVVARLEPGAGGIGNQARLASGAVEIGNAHIPIAEEV